MENHEKELSRITRVARLYSITMAFDYFTKRNLYRDSANSKNDYKQAEKSADLANFLFGDIKHATPQDFLYDRNEMSDKAIDYHEKYIHMLDLIDKCSNSFGLNSKDVDAFCKSVEYGSKCIVLKTIGHIQYPSIFAACISYMGDYISIDEFREHFVWVDFSMKREPVNIKQFFMQIRAIEEVYREIEEKRSNRKML